MALPLVDAITRLEGKRRIEARYTLSTDQPFLKDHFPQFPVMPGVLVLEALVQAGGWLVSATSEFAHSCVRLEEASQVKYSRFVFPGQTIQLDVALETWAPPTARCRGRATVEGQAVLVANFTLHAVHAAEVDPLSASLESALIEKRKREFQRLTEQMVLA